MRVLVCDEHKIEYFNLPSIVKDYFIINYNYLDNFETINLIAKDNKWVIESDKAINIIQNGNVLASTILEEYTSYQLYITSLDKYISIYAIPDLESYNTVAINNYDKITLGVQNCNINSKYLINCVIEKKDDSFYIKNSDPNVGNIYINKRKVNESILNIGDVIFINCVKIIWMGKFIKVNNPNNTVTFGYLSVYNGTTNNTCSYTEVTEAERNARLFSDGDAFFHIPRLHSTIKRETISFELPPEKDNSPKMPAVLAIGSSAIIGITSCFTGISAAHGLMTGTISKFDALIQFGMCISMLAACLLLPSISEAWQKRMRNKQEKLRQTKYKEYLNAKVDKINEIVNNQAEILKENNLPLDEISKRVKNNSKTIWGREIIDSDFLTVRLGLGDLKAEIDIDAPKKGFSLYDDNLKEQVEEIATKDYKMNNVPVTISMVENKVTPFIVNGNLKKNYINGIMLQILYYHSAMDLKIAVITNKENSKDWEFLKYSPYCFSENREVRFFSEDENEMMQLSMYLEQEYEKRLNDKKDGTYDDNSNGDSNKLYLNFPTYYLIITDDFKEANTAPIIEKIINSNSNLGFSLLIFENELNSLPNRVDKFVEINQNVSGIYSRSINDDTQVQFKAEFAPFADINTYTKVLGNIPVITKNNQVSLPTYLTFLDIYKAGKISQLNISSRWNDNSPINSLNAQVGVKDGNKPIGLDLHEKFHGPHGLIAGSTGSGKSEFIITYILSMAVNYSPNEVQFVLIDYKGGGLAGAFENKETKVKLPHLIGTITNLDTAEMNRTLVSIQSELKRRQRIFNEARDKLGESTIDIYKYQRLYREGKVMEPVSHLFIISDEFAELKAQQPDFMDELVSTARIGRSLGVHLILATQKPAGIVNDQIWSNSHFKVCLKVETSEDSTEVIKRTEASEIKETGRFYLQVGNNEIFELGQSAWSGAKYIPTNRYIKKINDDIEFINNNGQVLKSINNEITEVAEEAKGEQVTNIVKYMYDLAVSKNYNFKSLWLPMIPKEIYLGNVIKKYNYVKNNNIIEAVIGEYDKPAKQEQGILTLDLTCLNTLIYGIPGSGKENLLSTIIYSLCTTYTPNDINIYILDFGSGSLGIFNNMPHVGDVISSFEEDKIATQFNYLYKEIQKRKELFADYAGDYQEYRKNTQNPVPLIVTILNGYESFAENYGSYDDHYARLIRDGSKYGIVFIMTSLSTNSVRTTLSEYFANKILLQLPDKFDYQYVLGAERGMMPSKLFGRGMVIVDEEACEFQTAYIYLKDKINDVIRNISKDLNNHYQTSAPSIKILPSEVKSEKLLKFAKTIDRIPLGYSTDTADLIYYDFTSNKVNFIVGNSIIDDMDFMGTIIDFIDIIPDIHVNLFDLISCVSTDGNMSYYFNNYTDPFTNILKDDNHKLNVNIFLGIGDYKKQLSENEISLFENILNNLNNFNNQIFIFIDNLGRINNIINDNWFNSINHNNGIWYGNNIDQQDIFNINNLRNYDIVDNAKNIVYKIENGNYIVVKTIGDN